MRRQLIIDESLDKRLATELRKRGRDAESHASIGFTNLEDPDALDMLKDLATPWVLVTADDAMPWEHAEVIASITATVATIDGDWKALCLKHDLPQHQEAFKRDTVHRWAHAMAGQDLGSVRRYSPLASSIWTPRKKHAAAPEA